MEPLLDDSRSYEAARAAEAADWSRVVFVVFVLFFFLVVQAVTCAVAGVSLSWVLGAADLLALVIIAPAAILTSFGGRLWLLFALMVLAAALTPLGASR